MLLSLPQKSLNTYISLLQQQMHLPREVTCISSKTFKWKLGCNMNASLTFFVLLMSSTADNGLNSSKKFSILNCHCYIWISKKTAYNSNKPSIGLSVPEKFLSFSEYQFSTFVHAKIIVASMYKNCTALNKKVWILHSVNVFFLHRK